MSESTIEEHTVEDWCYPGVELTEIISFELNIL